MRLLFLIGLICLGYYLWGHKETYIARALSRQIGHPLSIDHISIRPNALSMKGVTLYHSTRHPALKVAQVHITGSWKTLFSTPVSFDTMTLNGILMYIDYEDRSHHNWHTLLAKSFPTTRPITIATCTVEEGQVFIKRAHKMSRSTVSHCQFTLSEGIDSGQLTYMILNNLLTHTSIPTSSVRKEDKPSTRSFDTPAQFENIRSHLHF